MSKLIYQGNSDLENNNDTLGIQEVSVKTKNKNKKNISFGEFSDDISSGTDTQIHDKICRQFDIYIYIYI